MHFVSDFARTAWLCALVVVPSLLVDLWLRGYFATFGNVFAFGLRGILFLGIFLVALRLTGSIRWIRCEEAS